MTLMHHANFSLQQKPAGSPPLRTLLRCAVLAALLGTLSSGALAGSGGSGYSVLGLGDLRYLGGTRSAGMGFTGLAIPSPAFLNPASAATWFGLDRARVEISGLYEGIDADNGISSRYLARVLFNGASLGIPISTKDGIAVAVGLVPYSSINFDTYGSSSAVFSQDTMQYTLHYTGSGFLGKGFIGLSWRPLEQLSLGASFDYYVGSLERAIEQVPSGTDFRGGKSTTTSRMSGASGTLSAVCPSFGFLGSALAPLSLGAVFSLRGNLRYRGDESGSSNAVNDTLPDLKGRAILPPLLGVGIAYSLGGRFIVAADYYTQQWEKAELSGQPLRQVQNAHRWAIGVERTGATEVASSFFNRASYRAGFTHNTTYYKPNGNGINEWFITAGATVPFVMDNWLAFAFEYGKRGTTEFGLLRDTFFRVHFSLNISETWFVTSEDE
jgi:hypothetical protein